VIDSPVENFLKPLRRHLDNQDYIELVCQAPGEIWAETRTGKWRRHAVPEIDQEYWANIARGLGIATGQRYSDRKPMIRGALPGGHRLFLMLGADVIDTKSGGPGICATIRLSRTFATEIEMFGVDRNAIEILQVGVKRKRNILVAGGMGSGKTSLTRILCGWVADHRPVLIEDTAEISLDQPVASQFLISAIESDTEINNYDMISALQRTRADRFILGEITMENAFVMMRILNLGSPGTIATVHCDLPSEAIESVSELMIMSGYAKDEEATKRYLERKIGLVVFVERAGPARVISEIFEPGPNGTGQVVWRRG
jgi:pilus assembly protein CpaF